MIRPSRFLVVGFIVFFLFGCSKKGELPPIRIGHVVAPVRADALDVERARQGIVLAVEEVNQEDRLIMGRRVEVIEPEVRNDREGLGATAARLVSFNKVAALLGGSDFLQVESLVENLGLMPESAKVPLVVAGGIPGRPANPFIYFLGLTPADQGRMLGRFAAESWQDQSIALLVSARESSRSYDIALADAFAREFGKSSSQVPGRRTFQTEHELAESARRLSSQSPAALVLAGTVEDLSVLRKAELAENVPILFAGPEGSLPFLANLDTPNTIYLATAFAITDKPEKSRDFIAKYQTRFHTPPDVNAVLAYDCARFLFDGLQKAKSLEAAKIRETLSEIKSFAGVTGELRFQEDNSVSRAVFIVELIRGKTKIKKIYEQ